ncbi:hypothetical protein OGZ01_29875 [Vibrio harveyi]|nr:hypothetical protein [Vibrio harveyi]
MSCHVMFESDKTKVKNLLIATRFGVSASEMPTIIGVKQDKALKLINELKQEGEDIHSLGKGITHKSWCCIRLVK